MTMAFITNGTIGRDLAVTETTAGDTVGNTVSTTDGIFMYVRATAALTQYDYVCVDEAYAAIRGTKAAVDDGHSVGVAQVAFAASAYGYVQMTGNGGNVRVRASAAADSTLYTTASAGILDDTSTSQTRVLGIGIVTAQTSTGTGNQNAIMNWPRGATI